MKKQKNADDLNFERSNKNNAKLSSNSIRKYGSIV